MDKEIKYAILRNLERELQKLEEYTDEMSEDNPDYEILDNCCYYIRDAYRDLKAYGLTLKDLA